MRDFKTFMSFSDLEGVSEITFILNKFNIPYRVQDTSKDFDVTFSSVSSKKTFLIMLDQNDFDKASSILEEKIKFDINEINKSHPLFSYSIEELKEVIKNHDEWHPTDVKLAKHLLEKENITVNQEEIKQNQLEKEIKSEKPEKSNLLTLIMGYGFSIIGGFVGIGIATFMLTGKKTLANGTKTYIYSKSDRNHGLYMLIIGSIFLMYFILKYN